MRGDPPLFFLASRSLCRSTPHARGSTSAGIPSTAQSSVYPACAGIHRLSGMHSPQAHRLPRMRGDPPIKGYASYSSHMSTPHARGSTVCIWMVSLALAVYPACAGIHLPAIRSASLLPRLPRMRGDPPHIQRMTATTETSTPHARGSTSLMPSR